MSGDDGMSLRDYFIAHAPAEPQPWFTPIMDIKRPQPHFDSSRSGNCLNRMALDSWDNEYDKQRHLQWPVAWADAMLAARGE
ncbi:MAG: hypothetical protein CVV44_04150 [Spirochaetae bacterium HGW-Spirochaetae-1]|nr:MAG: hypothetical protein CVV44_04150 [Spirochaetae bacterium HGW-Spirochaetae-1]